MSSPSLSRILRDHVSLSLTSFDRLYLGGYLPALQTSGQLVAFCRDRLHAPIPSRALFGPLSDRFVRAVHQFAAQHGVPVIHLFAASARTTWSHATELGSPQTRASWSSALPRRR